MNVDDKELVRFVGKAIASRRVQAGLTQEEVAEVLGIGNEAVSRMERGTVMPTVGRLVALAEIFGCGVGICYGKPAPRLTTKGRECPTCFPDSQLMIGLLPCQHWNNSAPTCKAEPVAHSQNYALLCSCYHRYRVW